MLRLIENLIGLYANKKKCQKCVRYCNNCIRKFYCNNKYKKKNYEV